MKYKTGLTFNAYTQHKVMENMRIMGYLHVLVKKVNYFTLLIVNVYTHSKSCGKHENCKFILHVSVKMR